MKRVLAISLIFIALTNIVGFMPLYFSLLMEIKSEVELEIDRGADLQQLQLTDVEYNDPAVFNKTDENEFSFKGQMYDYKEVKKVPGGYIFYALQDNKETSLIDFLKSTFSPSNENSKDSKGPLGNLLKNFSKDFIGSFLGTAISTPVITACRFPFQVKATCAGHILLIQNPPDIA